MAEHGVHGDFENRFQESTDRRIRSRGYSTTARIGVSLELLSGGPVGAIPYRLLWMNIFNSFKEVWLCDFEFGSNPGDRPEVRCLVAKEYHSGRLLRLWADDLGSTPPFDVGPGSLFVAYYASAELGCFLSLGWPIPIRILDLFTEFRT